jgi:hypothetical protein
MFNWHKDFSIIAVVNKDRTEIIYTVKTIQSLKKTSKHVNV